MRRFFVTALLLWGDLHASEKVEAALKSLQNQDQEGAFRTFLKALDEAKSESARSPSVEELKLYREALEYYLDHSRPPQETALQLLKTYGELAEKHPDYHQVRLLLALAHANLGQFKEFFTLFYPSFCAYPDHYLVYKTKAVLHIKLFERSRSVAAREAESAFVRLNVQRALERKSDECGLYKLAILFAEEKNKEREVEACLNKILNSSMIISRSDLPFFAQQTLDVRRLDLTERLIEKARHWYPYSRCLDIYQQRINDDPCK